MSNVRLFRPSTVSMKTQRYENWVSILIYLSLDGVLLGSSMWSRVVEQIPTRPKKKMRTPVHLHLTVQQHWTWGGCTGDKKLSLSCPDCWQLGSWFGCLKSKHVPATRQYHEHLVPDTSRRWNIHWIYHAHTVNIQSTHSQHTVNIQSTYSQHTVNIITLSITKPLVFFRKGVRICTTLIILFKSMEYVLIA